MLSGNFSYHLCVLSVRVMNSLFSGSTLIEKPRLVKLTYSIQVNPKLLQSIHYPSHINAVLKLNYMKV
jgi:hypothetical protein